MKRRSLLKCLSLIGFDPTSLFAAPVAPTILIPEAFGADPSGRLDSSKAISLMMNHSLLTGTPCGFSQGTYRLKGPIVIQLRGRPLSVVGKGIGVSTLLVDGWFSGLRILGDRNSKSAVHLEGFSLGRNNSNEYLGAMGLHTCEISNARGVVVRALEEWGAIGMGVLLQYCEEYEVSGCVIRDHKGGRTHRSGTDGIHIYRSKGPGRVSENLVQRVGDDAISFGSYELQSPTLNFKCFDNKIKDTAGSIKVYGNVSNFEIYANSIDSTKSAGINIWDDQGPAQSFAISNGKIYNNTIRNQIGAGASGGISVWSPTGDGKGMQHDIEIFKNDVIACNFGITLASQVEYKTFYNISVNNNNINDSRENGLLVIGYSKNIEISRNNILRSGKSAVLIKSPSEIFPTKNLNFSGNIIHGYSNVKPGSFPAIEHRDKVEWRLESNNIQ